MASGAAAGFVGGAISTGTLKGALSGALFGGLSAGMAYGIGHGFGANWGDVGRTFAHGVAQGGLSEAFGGDFRSGFIGGVIGHWSGEKLISRIKGRDFGAVATRTSIAAVAGGLSAKLGGGKFSNGAVSAAFVHLFNNEGHQLGKDESIPGDKALVNIINQREEGITAQIGDLTVDVEAGKWEGPFVVEPGDTKIIMSTNDGVPFGGAMHLRAGYVLDVTAHHLVDQVFVSSMIALQAGHPGYFVMPNDTYRNFSVTQRNLFPASVDVNFMGIEVFRGRCSLAGCAK